MFSYCHYYYSNWYIDLLERVGMALNVEANVLGVNMLLGPSANIKHTPPLAEETSNISARIHS
ncbi:MAG: hypothetical protein HUJ51_01555 [Eggerthellaceae bacterium]|nr:hypothetical protein [Eggerthellaceae bacterium]